MGVPEEDLPKPMDYFLILRELCINFCNSSRTSV
jgi:hypothetical protein